MRGLLTALAAATTPLTRLLGQADIFPGASSILQYGAFGVVCAAFGWLLWTQQKDLREEIRANTKMCQAILAACICFQQQLLAHDLTVSGINPATGKDHEERDSKAWSKYTEIQRQLGDMEKRIGEL